MSFELNKLALVVIILSVPKICPKIQKVCLSKEKQTKSLLIIFVYQIFLENDSYMGANSPGVPFLPSAPDAASAAE